MTENTTEAVVNAEDNRVIPAVDDLPDLLKLVIQSAVTQADFITELTNKVNAASGEGIGGLMTDKIESSTDPYVVERRDKLTKLHDAINRYTKEMEDFIRPSLAIPSAEEVEGLKTQVKAKTSEFKIAVQLFDNTAKAAGLEVTHADYVKAIAGMRKSGKSGGTSTTGEIRRPRIQVVAVAKGVGNEDYVELGSEVDGVKKSTFSHLTKYLQDESGEKVQTKDLQEAWFKANGSDDVNVLPAVSTFSYSVKGETFNVRITK